MLPKACFSNESGLQIKIRLEAKTFSRIIKAVFISSKNIIRKKLVRVASMWSSRPLCCRLSGGQCSASQWAAGKQSNNDILSDGESCGGKPWSWTVRQISVRCGRDGKKIQTNRGPGTSSHHQAHGFPWDRRRQRWNTKRSNLFYSFYFSGRTEFFGAERLKGNGRVRQIKTNQSPALLICDECQLKKKILHLCSDDVLYNWQHLVLWKRTFYFKQSFIKYVRIGKRLCVTTRPMLLCKLLYVIGLEWVCVSL